MAGVPGTAHGGHDLMIDDGRILGLVLARAGSKGFPGKNTARLEGRPLVAWPVRALVDCPEIDRVIVGTDGEAIAAVARAADAETPFFRPEKLVPCHRI